MLTLIDGLGFSGSFSFFLFINKNTKIITTITIMIIIIDIATKLESEEFSSFSGGGCSGGSSVT